MRNPPLLPLLLAALLVSGCVSVYKLDVQQGNVVTPEMLGTLKPGMTRNQVRYVLGTPLIADPFHQDRWDYFYSYKKGGADSAQTRRLTVIFRNDVLVAVDGDTVPQTGDFAAVPDGATPPAGAAQEPAKSATDATPHLGPPAPPRTLMLR